MKFIHSFFLSVLLIFSLLLSGQAFAVTYYSVGAGGLWLATDTWSNVSCNDVVGNGGIPNGGDTLIICNGSTVTVGEASAATSATVMTGGTLNLSTHVLTLSGALTNEGGTINGVSAQAFVAQSIVHNGGTTNLMGVTTNSIQTITINATGLTLPTGLILIDNLFTSNVDFSMPGSVAHITGGINVTGGTLTLTGANNVTGNIVINAGASISGTYPHPSGTTTTASLPLPPTCASGTHLIGSPGTYSCVADPATVPAPPTCLSSEHLTGSAGAYLCVPNPVIPISAPIFSTKDKARVFIEEVR